MTQSATGLPSRRLACAPPGLLARLGALALLLGLGLAVTAAPAQDKQAPASEQRGQGLTFRVPAAITTLIIDRLQADLRGPLKRFEDAGGPGAPADCAEAAVFLCSDAARLITGAVLPVDGGWCVSEGS